MKMISGTETKLLELKQMVRRMMIEFNLMIFLLTL